MKIVPAAAPLVPPYALMVPVKLAVEPMNGDATAAATAAATRLRWHPRFRYRRGYRPSSRCFRQNHYCPPPIPAAKIGPFTISWLVTFKMTAPPADSQLPQRPLVPRLTGAL